MDYGSVLESITILVHLPDLLVIVKRILRYMQQMLHIQGLIHQHMLALDILSLVILVPNKAVRYIKEHTIMQQTIMDQMLVH